MLRSRSQAGDLSRSAFSLANPLLNRWEARAQQRSELALSPLLLVQRDLGCSVTQFPQLERTWLGAGPNPASTT